MPISHNPYALCTQDFDTMEIKHVKKYPQNLVAVATISTENRVLKVGPLGCPSLWTPFASTLHCSASSKNQDLRFGTQVLHLTKNTQLESCIMSIPQSTTIDQNPKPKFCHLYESKKKIQPLHLVHLLTPPSHLSTFKP